MNWFKIANKEIDFEELDWKPYKKTAKIKVSTLEDLQGVNFPGVQEDSVDTMEGKQKVEDGDIIAKGPKGEIWPMDEKK